MAKVILHMQLMSIITAHPTGFIQTLTATMAMTAQATRLSPVNMHHVTVSQNGKAT